MPREMHIRSLDGTRWTSTSSAATLKAPHGGGVNGLESCGVGCDCQRCAQPVGLSGCGCGTPAPLRYSRRQPGLSGLGGVGPTQIDKLKSGERSLVSVEIYVYGQPPMSTQSVIEQTVAQVAALGYPDIKVSNPQMFPLAWSWAWEAGPKLWTAYVSNPDAGPFKQLLNIEGSSFFVLQDAAPGAGSTKNYPTQGALFTLDALPRADTVSPTELGALREALRKVSLTGSGVRMFVRVKGVPKKSNWLWGVLALGGLAYASSKQ